VRTLAQGRPAYRLKSHDIVEALLALVFAVFSLLWPDTGLLAIGGATIARGYILAVVYIAIAGLALLMPLLESKIGGPILAFVHTYYPLAFISLFFTDSILLSAQAFGGFSHDAFFAQADQTLFGYQPSRELSRAFGSHAWINELMFGAYFGYFFFMVFSIWIPFFKGNREEGERQVFTVQTVMGIACIWYVFFRVQGPKYWLPDLKAAWYYDIKGGLFVSLFKRSLAHATLSGAAFPSTHVILTLTTLGFAFRNDKRYFAVYLPVACLIVLATVYTYQHYAIDALGGIVIAATLSPLVYRLCGPIDRLAASQSKFLEAQARS
jgi:membrane-associated phospholipid phosphatase